MISYLKCAVEYLNENKMDKSPQLQTDKVGDLKLL